MHKEPPVQQPTNSIFDQPVERRNTGSRKWDGLKTVFAVDDLLPMWLADRDFAAPPPVVAVTKRAAHSIYGYPRITTKAFTKPSATGWTADIAGKFGPIGYSRTKRNVSRQRRHSGSYLSGRQYYH